MIYLSAGTNREILGLLLVQDIKKETDPVISVFLKFILLNQLDSTENEGYDNMLKLLLNWNSYWRFFYKASCHEPALLRI